MTQLLGWLSSAVLFATMASQVWKQWHERSSKGVSRWLFVGQVAASSGFLAYSWLVRNWVFVVTNAFLLAGAIAGALLTWHHRRSFADAQERTSGL